jgi:serine protease Do
MTDLKANGKVTRAQLGVSVQTVTADLASSLGLAEAGGVLVSGVSPDGAAARAGIKRGDVIKSLNGEPVHDMNTLRNRVADAGPGSNADLVIVRDGAEKHVTAKLDELDPKRARRGDDSGESDRGPDGDRAALGISVAPLTPELASRLGVPKDAHGLVIQDVDPDGRAGDAGLQAGDVIQEVNRQPVTSVEELRAAVRRSPGKPTLLLISRQGADIFVTVRPANG